jgi:hypothetical protein
MLNPRIPFPGSSASIMLNQYLCWLDPFFSGYFVGYIKLHPNFEC